MLGDSRGAPFDYDEDAGAVARTRLEIELMKRWMHGALVGGAILGGCASHPPLQSTRPPEPAKPVDEAKLFTGRWYEIARTPAALTRGCVAGTTDYYRASDGRLIDKDACRTSTPEGKEKTIYGPVVILNPGDNNKFFVKYQVMGMFYIPRTYWVLDHGAQYRWFIASDPEFKNLIVYMRVPRPDSTQVQRLVQRVQALGYDPQKLEFPATFPPGEGEAAHQGGG